MTTDLQNKWAEVIENSYCNSTHINWAKQHKAGSTFDDLPQLRKDFIFEEFIDSVTKVFNKDLLMIFVAESGLKDLQLGYNNISCDFNDSMKNHTYNIRGIAKYLVYSVLFNWQELFYKVVKDLNYYLIPGLKYITSLNSFTTSEIKEFVKICIEKIAQGPDFKKTFEEYVAPYQLK